MPSPPPRPARRSTVRRFGRLIGALVALDILIGVAATAVGGYALYHVQQTVRGGSLTHLLAARGTLRNDLSHAATAFGLARLCWAPWQPLAAGLSSLPPLHPLGGAQALLDLATSGSTTAAAALDGLTPAAAVLQQSHHSTAMLLAGLVRGEADLQRAREAMGRTDSAFNALDAQLPAALRPRVAPVSHLLPQADDALTVATLLPHLLGADGTRTYLLVPTNPWDLRAGGGFVGTAVEMKASSGALHLIDTRDSKQVDAHRAGYLPPPPPLLLYEHFSNWFYRDANWSPDFPTTAGLLRYFYRMGQVDHSQHLDGVIAFDSSLLPLLLTVTGPVSVPGLPTLTAENGVAVLDRYVNQNAVVNKGVAARAYSAVFDRLRGLGAGELVTALRILGQALQERHLLLWMADPTLEVLLHRHGWDGAISQTRDDYLYVVDTNVHYNKINQLVGETLHYSAAVHSDRSLRATLTIAYINRATSRTLPTAQNNTLYEDFLRVYVPLGSHLLSSSGLLNRWPTTRSHNKTVFSGYLRLASGARTTVTLTYRVPPNALLDPTHYTLTIQRQPGREPLPVSAELHAAASGIQVNGATSWAWAGRLNGDLTLMTTVKGGTARPLPLAYDAAEPTVGPGSAIDAWTALPAIELHAVPTPQTAARR